MSTRKSLKISLEIIIIFWICRLTTHLANVASCFPLCQFTQAPQFPTTTSPISSGFPKLPTPPGPFPSGLTSGVSPTSTSHSPSFPISNHHFSNFFRLPQISNTTWSIPFRPYLRCLPNFHLPLPKLPHFQPPLLQFLQASPNFQHHLVHSLQALPQVSPQLPPPTPQASPFPTTTSPISSGFPKLPTPPGPFPSGLTSGVSPTSTSHSPSFPISNHHFSNFFRLPQISNTTWSIPFRPYLRCLPNFHLPLPKLPHFQPPLLQFLQASPNFQHHLVHSLQALPQVSPQLPPPTPQASPFPTTTSPISSGFPKLPTPPGPFPSGLTSGVSPTSTSHSPSFPISNHHFSNFFRLPQTSNTTWSIPFQALPQVSPQLPPLTPQASPFPTTTSPISSGFPKLPTPPGLFPSGLTH